MSRGPRWLGVGLTALAAFATVWVVLGGASTFLAPRATGSGGIGSVSSGFSELFVELGLAAVAVAIVVVFLSVVTRKRPGKRGAS